MQSTGNKDRIVNLIKILGFTSDDDKVYQKRYKSSYVPLRIDVETEHIYYSETGIRVGRNTTSNFSDPENAVVLECVDRLLDKGYQPRHIELEPSWLLGHSSKGGYADIWVRTFKDNAFDGNDENIDSLLIIECKTPSEFTGAWEDTLEDGAQLFSYFQQEKSTKYLCLYTSDVADDKAKPTYHLINVEDNEQYLNTLQDKDDILTYKKASNNKQLYKVWHDTYNCEYSEVGLFETDIEPYKIGKNKYTIHDLKPVDSETIKKKYSEYATILRQHNVGALENAFDKLVNLFLAKIVDEANNPEDLDFYWKGSAYDDDYRLQDRLQRLYRDGMKRFLGEDVTYIEDKEIDKAFRRFKNDPDATERTIKQYFRALKFYSDNDFSFISVHNEQLFKQNAVILKKVVQMLENMRLKSDDNDRENNSDTQNQFLGDLFEGFLTRGVKQSEGQFFTPMPIVRFLVSALPLDKIIHNSAAIPSAIDYACGAGHFLTEYAVRIREFARKYHPDIPMSEYYARITGIEKEYRLSKVSKVSAFMYGHDEEKIIYADALVPNKEVPDNSFDVLIANPPYSVKGFLDTLTDEQRHHYTLYNDDINIDKNNAIETFFMERAAQLIKAGGVAGIILPVSVLNKSGIYAQARSIILKAFNIVALAEFGSGTFGKTGTNTVIMFLQRKETNTPDAEHYKNRCESWFANHHGADIIYQDESLLRAYCQHQGYDWEDYKAFLEGTVNDSLSDTDIFKAYRTSFFGNSRNGMKDVCDAAKDIHTRMVSRMKSKTFKALSAAEKNKEQDKAFYNFAREIEKEKVYYFLLCYTIPNQVIIVKSPDKTEDNKKYLGYEWSNGKGQEGIHYLNTKKRQDDEDDDEDLDQLKGIKAIQTPLFNPSDLNDENRINTLIRKNFLGDEVEIPEELKKFVSIGNLTDMIDFSRTAFNREIKTSVKRAITYKSKYRKYNLGDFALSLQRGKSPEYTDSGIQIIKSGQARGGYEFDFSQQYFVLDSFSNLDRKLHKGDILINSTGVGTVGRVTYFNLDHDFVVDSHITVLRPNNVANGKYLFYFLHDGLGQKTIEAMSNGASGQVELSLTTISQIKIPIPPKDIQEAIVSECSKVDAEYEKAKAEIKSVAIEKEKIIDNVSSTSNKKVIDLCKVINPSRSEINSVSDETMVSFVDMSSLGNGYIENKVNRSLGDLRKGSYTYFAEKDIIIAKITPCMENGKCAIAIGLTNGLGMGSTEYHVFRTKDDVLPEYLFAFLNREKVRKEAVLNMTGASGHRRVPVSFYEDLEIPVVPIEEQQRIVGDISKLDNKVQRLKKSMSDTQTRKQEILDKYLK
jgi:type I restriction-modification system DNA methylase subunit